MTAPEIYGPTLARRIVAAAIAENRVAELLNVLSDGGAATVQPDGRLALATGNQLAQFMSSTAVGTPGAVVEGASAGTSSRGVSDGQVVAAGAPVPAATTADQASVS